MSCKLRVGRRLLQISTAPYRRLLDVWDLAKYVVEEIRNVDKDVGWTEQQTGELAKVTATQEEDRQARLHRRFWKELMRDD